MKNKKVLLLLFFVFALIGVSAFYMRSIYVRDQFRESVSSNIKEVSARLEETTKSTISRGNAVSYEELFKSIDEDLHNADRAVAEVRSKSEKFSQEEANKIVNYIEQTQRLTRHLSVMARGIADMDGRAERLALAIAGMKYSSSAQERSLHEQRGAEAAGEIRAILGKLKLNFESSIATCEELERSREALVDVLPEEALISSTLLTAIKLSFERNLKETERTLQSQT